MKNKTIKTSQSITLPILAAAVFVGCAQDEPQTEVTVDEHNHGGMVDDGHDHAHADSSRYDLEIVNASSGNTAGTAMNLQFVIRDNQTGEVQKSFDEVHEADLHLIVVSEGLHEYQHVHPEMDDNGFWSQNLTLPYGGRYLVFAEGRTGSGDFITRTEFSLEGSPEPQANHELSSLSNVSGMRAEITQGTRLMLSDHAHVDVKLTPGDGWEPYLGVAGHLVLISTDGTDYIHAHPKGPMSGGVVVFDAHFHGTGNYRAWAQFKRDGRVVTFPFTIAVENAQ